MDIKILYGATLAERWGRSQNLAFAFARLGHVVDYLDCIRPAFRPSAAPVSLQAGLRWHRAAPGLPERPWSSGLHALWQMARLQRLPAAPCDLLMFYGVPHPWVQTRILKRFPHRRVIYDCADDKVATFRDLSGIQASRRVEAWERALVGRMDAVTAINRENLDRLDPSGRIPSEVVPNGVDLEHFRHRSRRIPPDGRFRIAYAGSVNARLDVAGMARMLESEPDAELHLFGGDHEVLDPIRNHPRVVVHGWVPYQELPRVLDACDVGLVPYLDLPSIRASSPLKSLQYLALGLPVAAFPYPGIPTLSGAVHLLDHYRLPTDFRSWSVPRPDIAQAHSWEASAELLLQAAFR